MNKRQSLLVLAMVLMVIVSINIAQAEDPDGTVEEQNFTASVEDPNSIFDERILTTFIAYQNTSKDPASVTFKFHDVNANLSEPITDTIEINGFGSGVYDLSSSELGETFRGGVTYEADKSVVITLLQMPSTNPEGVVLTNNRPMANGFIEGSDEFYIGTYLKNLDPENRNVSSVLAIQNTTDKNINVHTDFYAKDEQEPTITKDESVKSGQSIYYRARDLDLKSNIFNGSVKIKATGEVVASVLEMASVNRYAVAFEGLGKNEGNSVVYVPTALCDRVIGNDETSTTYYAVQNIGDITTTVSVGYDIGESFLVVPEVKSIPPKGKQSFNSCGEKIGDDIHRFPHVEVDRGYKGSAIIKSDSNADGNSDKTDAPIIVIGKAVSNKGLSTSFTGVITSGETLAIPFVRWIDEEPTPKSKTYIAIQNIGPTIQEGEITIKYYDMNGGEPVGIHTNDKSLNFGEKFNTTPGFATPEIFELGYTGDKDNGSAIIECKPKECPSDEEVCCHITATVRTSWTLQENENSAITRYGEDVNAFDVNRTISGGGKLPD